MMLAPETTSSTSAFHGLGCINSCCQAPPMCQEASYEADDNIQSEQSSSAHEPVNEGTNTTSSASEAMNMFSMLLTGLSAANMLNGVGTDAMLKDVTLIGKHWERLADKENSKPIAEAEKQRRKRLRISASKDGRTRKRPAIEADKCILTFADIACPLFPFDYSIAELAEHCPSIIDKILPKTASVEMREVILSCSHLFHDRVALDARMLGQQTERTSPSCAKLPQPVLVKLVQISRKRNGIGKAWTREEDALLLSTRLGLINAGGDADILKLDNGDMPIPGIDSSLPYRIPNRIWTLRKIFQQESVDLMHSAGLESTTDRNASRPDAAATATAARSAAATAAAASKTHEDLAAAARTAAATRSANAAPFKVEKLIWRYLRRGSVFHHAR